MPYLISDSAEGCDGWATVKDDGEVMGCHTTKQGAIDQALAIADSEGSEYLGEQRDLPDNYRPATSDDVPEGRACGNCLFFNEDNLDSEGRAFCERWDEYVAGGQYCNAWEPREEDRQEAQPAPEDEQIEGSDENEPGSAQGAGGDIKLSEATETALRNKVAEHNERMEADDKPAHTRTTYGQLAAVYRRGAGAYSSSHRPGVSRGAWAMARVNAYLYLLRNGKPENANYVTDNDLLPEGHPKSTRSATFTDDGEQRQVNLDPPAYMRASARRGLEWHREGLSGDGVVDRTIREARAMAEGNVTADKWVRLRAWIARHLVDMDAPRNIPGEDGYPGPGAVAMALWGGGGTKRSAERALAYADGVVGRIEEENEGRAKGQALSKMETRINPTTFEIRELDEDGGMTFEGYASVFNSRSENLGGFHEVVAPGAFKRSLQSRNDIKLLFNHDTGSVLGSTRAGSMTLTEDEVGLKVRAELPNTTLGRDTAELIRTGLIDSMSFGFSVVRDTWDESGTNRTLNAVRIHEASIVSFPAYAGTAGTVSVRGLDAVAQRAKVDADELADALLKIESGDELSTDEAQMLSRVVDELKPEDKAPESNGDLDILALKKKKLELLEKF